VKTQTPITRLLRNFTVIGLFVSILASVGCTTTYDRSGRPVQSVDPGTAVAAAAAAGVLGYAIGQNNDRRSNYRRDRYYGGRSYYRSRSHYHRYR